MQRTLNDLFKETIKKERKVKIIDPEGAENTGLWYEDHMLDVYFKYRNETAEWRDANTIRIIGEYETEIRSILNALVEHFMDKYIDINTEMDSIAETIIEIFGDMTIDGVSEVIVNNEREYNRISAYINTECSPMYYIDYETTPQNAKEYIVYSVTMKK